MTWKRLGPSSIAVEVTTEIDMERLGRSLAEVVMPGTVIGLVGTLGAGKTRLVRALAERLGAEGETVTSPTFVLIHEYAARMPISHFDAYRLADPDEFDALGASDHWSEGDRLCLIEWADLVSDRLPASTWWIRIDLIGPTARRVRIDTPSASDPLDGLEAALGR